MKLTEIPYYVEFVFSSSNGDCMATADQSLFKFIKHEASDSPVNRLEIGNVIRFEPENKKYKINNIIIRQIFEDTEFLKYGFDMEGCSEIQGERKEWLFSILVEMEPA